MEVGGGALDTLPERLALASTGGMGHAEFLELLRVDLLLIDDFALQTMDSADTAGFATVAPHSVRTWNRGSSLHRGW